MSRIFRPTDWVAMPWKNGGGVTHEILREGGPDGFTLRISVATIAETGPFSRFPGIDRVLVLLEGAGCRLRRDDHEVVLEVPGDWFGFPGEDGWDCELVGGTTRDFNLMTDRAVYSPRCELRREEGCVISGGERSFLFALGEVRVGGSELGRWELVEFSGEIKVSGRFFWILLQR